MSCNGLLVVTKCIAAHFPHEVDKQKPIQSVLTAVMRVDLGVIRLSNAERPASGRSERRLMTR